MRRGVEEELGMRRGKWGGRNDVVLTRRKK